MIVQNVGRGGVANLTFTVPLTDKARAVKALEPVLAAIGGGQQVAVQEHIAKLSVVGVGMKTHSGVAATLFQALAEVGINIDLISTSEIKISVVVDIGRARTPAPTRLGSHPGVHRGQEPDRQPHRASRAQISRWRQTFRRHLWRWRDGCGSGRRTPAPPRPEKSLAPSWASIRPRDLGKSKWTATGWWNSRKSPTWKGIGSTPVSFLPARFSPALVGRGWLRAGTRTAGKTGAGWPAQHLQTPGFLGLHGHPARPRFSYPAGRVRHPPWLK